MEFDDGNKNVRLPAIDDDNRGDYQDANQNHNTFKKKKKFSIMIFNQKSDEKKNGFACELKQGILFCWEFEKASEKNPLKISVIRLSWRTKNQIERSIYHHQTVITQAQKRRTIRQKFFYTKEAAQISQEEELGALQKEKKIKKKNRASLWKEEARRTLKQVLTV
ncbi:hypothetical protein AXF42_Ash003787 [Apostasia shenzhenica]|uniref:Uncharacterized protein n=1 Tax=Apostasia shenzhenica TaxID=1088818 RepID=A0A2I0AHY4_9ASPA|nr:hypothetical protein AXF42_Ash003787 [Apostasia shenzhenica]